MSKRAAWSTVVVCALLAGCAAMHPRVERKAMKQECESDKKCTVTVTVTCDTSIFLPGCTMSVDYDLIVVNDRHKTTSIDWVLSSNVGAEFASNGIVLDNEQFRCPKREKKAFTCTDQPNDFGVFKYAINVTVPDGPFGPRGVPSLDPWVVNK